LTADHSIGKGIIKQIIDGTITIDSVDECESILTIFPDNPEIRQLYADLLVDFRKIDRAAASYHRASEQFLEKGAIPQAIVAILLAWQLRKPTAGQLKSFYHRLLESNQRASPLGAFLADLSRTELLSLIVRMERIQLPPNRTFISPGRPENSLYIIVHGSVASKGRHGSGDVENPGAVRRFLDNDVFGDILPLETPTFGKKTVKTLEQTELIRISKESLAAISSRFPAFAEKLSTLLRRQRIQNGRGGLNRRTFRRDIPVRIKVESPVPPGETVPLMFRGKAKDMSIDGISIVLDRNSASAEQPPLTGKLVTVHMNLPNESMALAVRGRIVWDGAADRQTSSRPALGIQFLGLPPSLSGLLTVIADSFARL
jgi:CRP-like cAMP-binding protein